MPNQRRRKVSSAPSRSTKAVLGRLSSLANEYIQESSRGRDSRQTAAGFPAKGRSAKASTWYISIGPLLLNPYRAEAPPGRGASAPAGRGRGGAARPPPPARRAPP